VPSNAPCPSTPRREVSSSPFPYDLTEPPVKGLDDEDDFGALEDDLYEDEDDEENPFL
jgi:hypothetical protein